MRYLFLLLLAALLLPCRSTLAQTTDGRPNIVIVMADDMGFSDLGCYGGEINTPTIDRLADEGVRYTQFYNFAVCGPSRAALMTGCYPWLVGQQPGSSIFANLTGNCITLMELMHAGGYQTCAVGRLDMVTTGNWHTPEAIALCVDRFLGSASGGPGNYYREVNRTPWFRDGVQWDRPTGPYSTDLITTFLVDVIDGSSDDERPLFIYVSHYAPHWPLQADEQHIAPYRDLYEQQDHAALVQARLDRQIESGVIPADTELHPSVLNPEQDAASNELPTERMAIHAAMVQSIDSSLAQIIDALDRSGRLENTLILVLSDNGASHQLALNRPVPEGVRPGSMDTFLNQGAALATLNNTPLRGFKQSNYEGGIASPLIAWWPTGIQGQGVISDQLLHIADIMPTCLELAGVDYPDRLDGLETIPLSGASFSALLSDPEAIADEPRVVVWPNAIRVGDWKLVLHNPDWPELYSISADRGESHDLADDNPQRVSEMHTLHEQLYPGNQEQE